METRPGFMIVLIACLIGFFAQLPQRSYINPAVAEAVGGYGLFDTLAVVAGGWMPSIDTVSTEDMITRTLGSAADPKVIRLALYRINRHVVVDYGTRGITRRVWDDRVVLTKAEVRTIAAHEFGHHFGRQQPELYRRFVVTSPTRPAIVVGLWRDHARDEMVDETFADAFAEAVCSRLPETQFGVGFVPYNFYRAWTEDGQRAMLDSAVTVNWPR